MTDTFHFCVPAHLCGSSRHLFMDGGHEMGGSEQQSTLSFPTHMGGALHSVKHLNVLLG